ncbi:MAG: cell wall-binding repeat-containing protein [Erysipelotrichaceae bacterium]|nr:cell wall-binding repeat-containing protein [Erysipelotrichaceae bacterium]
MKKIMKVFVSILVMAMMVTLVPVQQVKAEAYVFVADTNLVYNKSNFEETALESVFETVDEYGATHAFALGGFEDAETAGDAVLYFVYGSDVVDNKAPYFVIDAFTHFSNGTVKPSEEIVCDVKSTDLGVCAFQFNIDQYNHEFLYFYVGIFDPETNYKDFAKIKVANPYVYVPLTEVRLPETEDVGLGQTDTLVAKIYPSNTTEDKTVVWSSDNEDVVKIDANGVMTGVAYGSATITATSKNGKEDSCVVTVKDPVVSMEFAESLLNTISGDVFILRLNMTPSEDAADMNNVRWEIEDKSIVGFSGTPSTDDMNQFRPLGPGTTTVTATLPNGLSATATINVDAPITSIHIGSANKVLYVGDSFDYSTVTTIYPTNTNHDRTLTWSTSDETIATVDENGVLTCISSGEVYIFAEATNGVRGSYSVTVHAQIPITEVEIVPAVAEVFVGETYYCYATVKPTNTSFDETVVWTTSDETIATVDQSGAITGVASGTCVITATSINGLSDSITINVSEGATRIFGDSRYETAFKVADALKAQLKKDKFSYVIVASGTGFADALAGSYLSAQREAPILMTDMKQKNIDNLVAYINKNLTAGGTVYVLGGTAAVSENVDKALSNYNVKRLAGKNRYETNMKIINEVITGKYDDELLICTATNFADSLSVSATGLPIMLVGNSLTEEQRDFIARQSISNVYIIGGTAAVSKKLEKQVDDALPSRSIQIAGKWEDISAEIIRIAGASRYETSTLVAKEFLPDAKKAVMAYAKNYPDGLSGGALAYSLKAPLLLTDGNSYSVTSKYTVSKKINSGFVLGGSGLVTDEAVRSILGLPSNQEIQSK